MSFENRFDLVFSNSVLHWVPEIEDGVERFYRALKQGGVLAVQFPLLNANHPLIQYAGRAIRELGFAERCGGWDLPWFVPNSEDQFAGILKKFGFADVEVSREASGFLFPSAEAVYWHFSSVGLNLFAAPLDAAEQSSFFSRVLRDLTEDFPAEAELRYERIFAKAAKLELK